MPQELRIFPIIFIQRTLYVLWENMVQTRFFLALILRGRTSRIMWNESLTWTLQKKNSNKFFLKMQKNFLLFNSLRDKRPGREPLAYICDFSRYEKSSSMKRPTLKVIDFDSVVQNTKSSKSIILMSAFSNILLQSRSSEATNIGYRFSSRAVFGWILIELR